MKELQSKLTSALRIERGKILAEIKMCSIPGIIVILHMAQTYKGKKAPLMFDNEKCGLAVNCFNLV